MDPAYTPSSHSVTFAVSSGHAAGESIVVVGDRKALGSWTVDEGVRLAAASGSKYTATVPVGAAGIIQYKFVIVNAEGVPCWEVGSNRLRNVTQDESIDCGVFHTTEVEASNQQLREACIDHRRYFELFASPTEFYRLEDKVSDLNDTVESVTAQNKQLLQELEEAQTRLAAATSPAPASPSENKAPIAAKTAKPRAIFAASPLTAANRL